MPAVLDGEHLTIAEVREVAERRGKVSLAPAAVAKMQASREPVERLAAGDEPIYGVNTGVGLLADIRIPREDLDQLQLNVVRSHAAGVGPPLAAIVAMALNAWAWLEDRITPGAITAVNACTYIALFRRA